MNTEVWRTALERSPSTVGRPGLGEAASGLACLCPSAGSMSSRKGLNGTCSVHEYSGAFAGQPARFKMTSVCGHVMTLDFLGECRPIPPRSPAPRRRGRRKPGVGSGQRGLSRTGESEASRLWGAALQSLPQQWPSWRRWPASEREPGPCGCSGTGRRLPGVPIVSGHLAVGIGSPAPVTRGLAPGPRLLWVRLGLWASLLV